MEFINKVAQTVSKTYHVTAQQTEKLAKKMKLNAILDENQEKIEDLYQEIGKIVYQKHVLDTDDQDKIVYIEEELMNECSKIDSLADEIADTRKELLKLREKKQCQTCQEEVLLDAKFCPYCGARQGKPTFVEIQKECEEQKQRTNFEPIKQEPVKRGRPKKEQEKKEEIKPENNQNQE